MNAVILTALMHKFRQLIARQGHSARHPIAVRAWERLSEALDSGRVEDPLGYVVQSARLCAIDLWRAAEREERLAGVALAEAADWAQLDKLHWELYELTIDTAPTSAPTWEKWMEAVRALVDGTSTAELQRRHGATDMAVYQWRRRGLKALEPFMSPALKEATTRSNRLIHPEGWSEARAERWRRDNGRDALPRERA